MQTFGGKDAAIHIAACERASFCLVSRRKGGEALPESRQSPEVAEARTFGLVNLAFSRQTGLRCEHLFIDKPTIITEPAVPTPNGTGIRPGFKTGSRQQAAHSQQRIYSSHAESLSIIP